MRDIKKQLETIAEKANDLLRKWGVDEPIVICERGERKETSGGKWKPPFWGFGSWKEPTYIFSFMGIEIGAYSDKAKIIKVRGNHGVVGRPYSLRCRNTNLKAAHPFSIDFFLALFAFRFHFARSISPTRYTELIVSKPSFVELRLEHFRILITFSPLKATLMWQDRVYQDGDLGEILVWVNRVTALARGNLFR